MGYQRRRVRLITQRYQELLTVTNSPAFVLPAGNWITVRSASVLDAMLLIVNSSISTLAQLEDYYDSAPRARSRVEEIGPFTLFVAESGWPYYARPRLGWSRKARLSTALQN